MGEDIELKLIITKNKEINDYKLKVSDDSVREFINRGYSLLSETACRDLKELGGYKVRMGDTKKAFPFLCSGFSYDSTKEAWEDFYENLQEMVGWIKGYKYWRMIPELETDICFDTQTKIHRVFARVIATKDKTEGEEEITIKPPYKTPDHIKKFEDGTLSEYSINIQD